MPEGSPGHDLGETALHVAALRGHERVCKWLLERPSCDSVDPQDWTTGATPLWNACQAGKLKAAKVLLAKGADPEAAPVFGEYRNVTAKTMALNKHWDDLINETAELRAAEEARLQAKKEKRIRRRNRYNLAVADRDRRIREKEAARLLMIEERQYRAKDRVKKRFESFIREGLRGAWLTWLENYFNKEELKSRGTFKGNNLAKRAKAAWLDFIRLQSDPREVARRKAVAREERRQRRRIRHQNADNRRANNMLRTAWRGNLEERPPLTADERADRKDRMDSCPRNGFPSPTVSRRVYVDATSPDRSDRLDALTAEGFALLAQAQGRMLCGNQISAAPRHRCDARWRLVDLHAGERDRLEKERLRAERAEAEAEELALMAEFEEKEKLESDPPEDWNIERLKDFLREKGDRSMAGADKLGYPEKIREALVKRVRMHLSKPKRSRGLARSGREERMERMRRKKLTDLEREEEDEAKEKAKDLAWKNMEDFDEVAWLENYLAGVKARKDEALAHEKKLEELRKKAYGDAPPSY